jgi:ribosomal protein S18 acetylase RimI-like enzyme
MKKVAQNAFHKGSFIFDFMDAINYHKAGPEDINALVDYRIIFALDLTGKQSPDAITILKTQMRDYFTRAMSENNCISFIARSGDEVAGIGSVQIREQPGNFKNPSGRWGYIMNMYTLPHFRRRGICKTILEKLVTEGKSLGIDAFELHATPAGEEVYKRNGFELHKEPTYRRYPSLNYPKE